MAIIQLVNIRKNFGTKEILKGISASIYPHSRIGLVGANGSGKTTLVRILLGQLEEDGGEVIRQRNLKIGYLPQISTMNETNTVLQEALESNKELFSMQKQIEVLEKKLSTSTESNMEKIIEEHDQLVHLFESKGGYKFQKETEAMLGKLGFSPQDFSLPIRALSGGQKNRLGLLCTLIADNELLVLDEPTNFLDIQGTEWLEEHLKSSSCPFLVISHDRYFLNQIANEIWEISDGILESYPGNYDAYCLAKEARIERELALYERQQEEIEKKEEFIRRNFYGQKHRQAQCRRRMLERMERLSKPKTKVDQPKFTIQSQSNKSGKMLDVRNLSHAFDSHLLFSGLCFSMDRKEKLAIVGPNGCGKSTLLHILIGRIKPTSGTVVVTNSSKPAFYHQELADLKPEETPFDTIKNLAPTVDDQPVRDFLAKFLFRKEEIYKPISSLSGGEKSRLALAKLLYSKPDFLVLDEPTNHLDIPSRQALEMALQDYDGTLLFVSHDRYFIDEVATRILYFFEKTWISFYGNYSEFQASKEYILPQTSQNKGGRTAYQTSHNARPPAKKGVKKKYTLEQLEQKIIEAETRLKQINQQLLEENIYRMPEKIKELKQESEELIHQLQELNQEWETWT